MKSPPKAQEAALEELRDTKGYVNTEALVTAIPHLQGALKEKARDALAERLTRMTDATLRDKLSDDDTEIRSARRSCVRHEGSEELRSGSDSLAERSGSAC